MSADGRSGEGSAEQSGGLPAVQPGALSAEQSGAVPADQSGAVPGEQPAALPAGLSGEVTASRRVVISSVTGKPIPWESEESAPAGQSARDAELLRNLPPHWGR